jgi:hypothetical protein
MTVQTTAATASYAGNGATTSFPYPFPIPDSSQVVVSVASASGVVSELASTQYSISGLGSSIGGAVIYPLAGAPLAVGMGISIERVLPLVQATNLPNSGGWYPAVVEAQMDYAMMCIQQLQAQLGRQLTVPAVDLAPNVTLPPLAARAGQLLGFDSTGSPIAAQPSSALISAALQPFAASASTTAALSLLQYQDPAVAAVARSITARIADAGIYFTDFAGADPTNTTFCDAPWVQFVAAVMASGRPGIVPAGHFKFANAATMDFGLAAAAGGSAKFYGVQGRSILDFTAAVAASPALQITDSVGGKACFYGAVVDITVLANCPAAAVAIGLTNHSDAFNGFHFRLQIANSSASAAAIGLQINGAYNCDFWVTANNGGHGDAIQITEMAFCKFFGAGGHCDNALHLTLFYVFGNVFHALDLEVCNTCVVIDSANCSRNTWLGGQFVWSNGTGPAVAGINATQGGLNQFMGVNYASGAPIATGQVGIIVVGQGIGTEVFGGILVSPLAGDAAFAVDTVAGNTAEFVFRVGGVIRWAIARNNAAETGGNVGSDLLFTNYNDAGAAIGNVAFITRSTGAFNNPVVELGAGGGKVGFYGAALMSKESMTGSKASGAALASVISCLASIGLFTDTTTA